MISVSMVSPSIAIRAPVLVDEKSSTASTSICTVAYAVSLFISLNWFRTIPLLPSCSSALRISGWKSITTAMSPTVISLVSSQLSRLRSSISDRINTATIKRTPQNICCALVSLIKPSILYIRNATTRISITSVILMLSNNPIKLFNIIRSFLLYYSSVSSVSSSLFST